jgi:hypothetical protein
MTNLQVGHLAERGWKIRELVNKRTYKSEEKRRRREKSFAISRRDAEMLPDSLAALTFQDNTVVTKSTSKSDGV